MGASVSVKVGQRVPRAFVAELDGESGLPRPFNTDDLFSGARILVIGVPGAFTPVCTYKHLPPMIARADELHRAGYRDVICMCPSDPFSLDAWARQIDPERKLRFISDGNLHFTRLAGLISNEPNLFLGARSKRYAMVLESAIVKRLSIEESVLDVTCTGIDNVLEFV